MPSRYHPIEDGLWDDPKFDRRGDLPCAPGDERGFFAFLATNKFQRLPGIYRATDFELAAAYRWPVRRVTACLLSLCRRGLIVRDGAWIFLPGYLKRQAHNPSVLKSAQKNLESCTSFSICAAFIEHYPLYRSWCRHGADTVPTPITKNDSSVPEQYQSRAEQSRADAECSDRAPEASAAIGVTPPEEAGALDPVLKAILTDCPHLKLVSNGESGPFWDQVLGACEPYTMADGAWLGVKLRAWDQWFASNPSRQSRDRRKLESRLMVWLSRDLEQLARRRA